MDELTDKQRELLNTAIKRYKAGIEAEDDNRDRAADDFRFAAGEQWPDEVKRNRENDGRPCLTINRLPQFIGQVENDARQNKPAIKIRPKDAKGSEETAKVYEGLIRQIEGESHAEQAYITGLNRAATGGFGAWRVTTQYADDDAFEQDIRIRRIVNPFSVVFDPDAKEYDKSDSGWAFVTEWISKDTFESRYPDATPSNWDSEYTDDDAKAWLDGEKVRVAEYWVREQVMREIGLTADGKVLPLAEDDGRKIEYPEGMFVRTRKAPAWRVRRYVLSGHAVLQGPEEWAGKYIPLVPIFGPDEFVDGEIRYRSVIRYGKDPQRQYNYWQSQITEKIALAPKAPFTGTAKMFAGYEEMWANANRENYAFLPFNADPQAPNMRPTREAPALLNQAELAQSATAVEDLKATTGIYDASLGNRSNETSGIAIAARQSQGDRSTFGWIDNLSRSIEHTGRILVDLIPRIYDTERTVRIMGEDGKTDAVRINAYAVDEQGQPTLVHDLSAGKYLVDVDTGPSFATRRQESAVSMLEFIRAFPAAAPVLGDLLARNMDWPGADDVSDRLKKLLPPGMDEDAPPPQPSPAEIMQMQRAQMELYKLQADIAKTGAETRKTQAQTVNEFADAEDQIAQGRVDVEGKELDNAQKALELAMQTQQFQMQMRQMIGEVLSGLTEPTQ